MTEEYGHISDAFDMLPEEDLLMTEQERKALEAKESQESKHPANDWEWEDTAEVAFQEWFNGEYGNFTFRCEWFFGDCKVQDENTLKDLMYKWLHSSFLTGYNTGRCAKTND